MDEQAASESLQAERLVKRHRAEAEMRRVPQSQKKVWIGRGISAGAKSRSRLARR